MLDSTHADFSIIYKGQDLTDLFTISKENGSLVLNGRLSILDVPPADILNRTFEREAQVSYDSKTCTVVLDDINYDSGSLQVPVKMYITPR